MIKCPKCLKLMDLQQMDCSYCGETLKYTIAQKFDLLAESVENALKKELEERRKRH